MDSTIYHCLRMILKYKQMGRLGEAKLWAHAAQAIALNKLEAHLRALPQEQ